jgi:hypothetical protein
LGLARSACRVGGGAAPHAADTAFLTNNGAHIVLDELEVTAVADELPDDDWTSPAQLR